MSSDLCTQLLQSPLVYSCPQIVRLRSMSVSQTRSISCVLPLGAGFVVPVYSTPCSFLPIRSRLYIDCSTPPNSWRIGNYQSVG